jgi:ribonuclease BN (tRNA processing enzyme)
VTSVTFLGSGDAFSAGGRHQAAYLIQSGLGCQLLDCGATFLASMKWHNLSPAIVDDILLSHLHGDHFAGLPFLFLHYIHIEPRQRPLRIFGPPGVGDRVTELFRAMYPDSASQPLPYALEFYEAKPDTEFSPGTYRVIPFEVPHQERPQSFGLEVWLDGRKIVYSGDAGWTEALVEHSQNADLFLCECTFFETRLDIHLDYPRIMENLSRFGAKRIVLTHLGHEMLRRKEEVALEMAHDGLVVTL